MTTSSTPVNPAIRVLTDAIPGDRARDALLVLGFAGSIAVTAQMYVYLPGNPVPITGQTFAVLAGAIVLGAGRATMGAFLYLALGVLAVPWFAASSGATLGYIVGFVAASMVLGAMAQRGLARGPLQVTLAMVLGNVIIYAFGATWLGVLANLDVATAIELGILPFLIGDAIKIALAVAIVPTAWALVERER